MIVFHILIDGPNLLSATDFTRMMSYLAVPTAMVVVFAAAFAVEAQPRLDSPTLLQPAAVQSPAAAESPVWANGQIRGEPTPLPSAWASVLRVSETGPGRVRVVYGISVDSAVQPPSTDPGEPLPPALDEGISVAVAAGLSSAHPGQLLGLYKAGAVGIPLSGDVRLELVEAREVGRVPVVAGVALPRLLSGGPVILGETGFLRRQRLVELAFGPRLSEAGDELIVYDRIVADIFFDGDEAKTRGSRRRERWAEMAYRQTVLNYEQARSWRQPPPARRPLAKRAQEGGQQDLVKIVVRNRGIYRISGNDLKEAGIAIEGIQSDRMRLLYAGGGILGLARRVPQGLVRLELAMVVEDGGDGRFDVDDFILFFGEPPARWEYNGARQSFSWRENRYTEQNVYWLELDGAESGRRAQRRSGAERTSDPWRPTSYRERLHEEDERFILLQLEGINSGYDWYWEDFRGNARNFSTIIKDADPKQPVDIGVRFYGWSDAPHSFEVRWNGEVLGQPSFAGSRADTVRLTSPRGGQEGLNQLGLFHLDSNLTRLDWYELEFSRGFAAEGGELIFGWPPAPADAPAAGEIAEFRLTGFGGGPPRIFEVSVASDLKEIVDFAYDESTGEIRFQDRFGGVGTPPMYAVVTESRWRRPSSIAVDRRTSLRTPDNGAEYVIITHSDFRTAADRLASWRAADDRFGEPLSVAVVNVEDIYDEFSGGLLDPMAIRSFVNYAVDNWDPAPFFVLLMGDGTYDYKNNSGTSHTNWIPPYQAGISTYDEWYVRIEGEDVFPDLAIGRLPVPSAAVAEGLVDKLIAYDRQPELGPWQSRVLLIADDLSNPQNPAAFESYFIQDAEHMARRLLPEDLDLVKLYIAEFPLEGRAKPSARDEFIRRFNEGYLILTYLGHGNPDVLSHELMFRLSRDLHLIDNGMRLPFMYTAASQVGVFDDPSRQSMPEVLLNRPDGGVVGFISATRLGYHDTNMVLAREFHRLMYRNGQTHVPTGLALMAAKQNVDVPLSGNTGRVNVQRYSLLGDPAQRLAQPRLLAQMELPDTLRALEEVHVTGRILDSQRRVADGFNGQAWVKVFDSTVLSKLEGQTILQLGAPLFRGLVPVSAGRFAATFRIPKDINYRQKEGRASAYAWTETGSTASGSTDGLVLAGTAQGVVDDDDGPEIRIAFRNQQGFRSGDFVAADAVLEAEIRDPSGINITGETGHEIILQADDKSFKVTEFFSNRGGDYRIGFVEFELPPLDPGTHTLRLKAWDSFNNSAVSQVQLQVGQMGESVLSEVLFFPNPMVEPNGYFTYILSAPAESVRIRVFSLTGKLVDDVEGENGPGYHQIEWRPPAGLANSSYLYRLQVALEDGGELTKTAAIQVAR